MFNKVDSIFIGNGENQKKYDFAFLNSLNVQAYPCGRRRYINTNEENSNIPFDPEARLNTEANNRSLVSINGYTQTCLLNNWESDRFLLSLAGYRFNVTSATKDVFTEYLADAGIDLTNTNKIYANIRIENVLLLSKSTVLPSDYYTSILRDQTATEQSDAPATYLDMSDDNGNSFYFSGLSFSTTPLVDVVKQVGYNNEKYTMQNPIYAPLYTEETAPWCILNSFETFETDDNTSSTVPYQQVVSLCILHKVNNEWQVYQPSLLPQIAHGETEGSIKVDGNIAAESISVDGAISTRDTITANVINANEFNYVDSSGTSKPVTILSVAELENDQSKKVYQLQFSYAKKL